MGNSKWEGLHRSNPAATSRFRSFRRTIILKKITRNLTNTIMFGWPTSKEGLKPETEIRPAKT